MGTRARGQDLGRSDVASEVGRQFVRVNIIIFLALGSTWVASFTRGLRTQKLLII